MIYSLNTADMTDEDLIAHDKMMCECVIKIEAISKFSLNLWSAILKELSERKIVTLSEGSFDDIGNAHILRDYEFK